MQGYSLKRICEITGSQLIQQQPANELITQFFFDTRRIITPQNGIFIALQQQRDGHQFVPLAYQIGVRNFLVSQSVDLPSDANLLLHPHPLKALQTLAGFHRQQFTGKVIGITGSNGKTTVKEWLFDLLQPQFRTYAGPGSWNSQLGVALALLEINFADEIAIIEAGISQPAEMQTLANMIRPNIGIFTHFGDAHAENFHSAEEKLTEKWKLFDTCTKIICYQPNLPDFAPADHRIIPIGTAVDPQMGYQLTSTPDSQQQHFSLNHQQIHLSGTIPAGPATLENTVLAVAAAIELGANPNTIEKQIPHLRPVQMRLELITDNPDITILNDAYSADRTSVLQALAQLAGYQQYSRKVAILSDLATATHSNATTQLEMIETAIRQLGIENVLLVGPLSAELTANRPRRPAVWHTTEALIDSITPDQFKGAIVLLKGARKFALERLIPVLTRRTGHTYFKINLNALQHNLNRIRAACPNQTVVAMVKAQAYGSGNWQIARALEQQGVDRLAVAYPGEGIELREHSIHIPIMVLQAAGAEPALLNQAALEPVVSSMHTLKQFVHYSRLPLKIHIEFDTGMGRLGFLVDQAPAVIEHLRAAPHLQPLSLMTHLAGSEAPDCDTFTQQQLAHFQQVIKLFRRHWPAIAVQALNTGGILRYHTLQPNLEPPVWIRPGIGLYGISPVESENFDLTEVGSLHSAIIQLHQYPAGTTIGYNRNHILSRPATIATVGLGYADGVPRLAGNSNYHVLVRQQFAPIVGNVCMDMLMIDVTDIPSVTEGDEVVIFGKQGNTFQSVKKLAAAAHTIAYEILTGIGQRVRRIYVSD
jgi:alanine racemase